MESGSISQWAALGFSIVAGVFAGARTVGKIKGQVDVIDSKVDDLKERTDKQDQRMDKMDTCIANVKKRATDFLAIEDFRTHTTSCRFERREENKKKDSEIEKLQAEISRTHEAVEKVGSMVKQLLVLQDGKVR